MKKAKKGYYLTYENNQPTFTELAFLVEKYQPKVILVSRKVADILFGGHFGWKPDKTPAYFYRDIPCVLK